MCEASMEISWLSVLLVHIHYITLHTYKVYRYMCHYLRMILYDYKLKSCHVSFQRLVLNERQQLVVFFLQAGCVAGLVHIELTLTVVVLVAL